MASRWGSTILQGLHQSAQKSTKTGRSESSTTASKSWSLTLVRLPIVVRTRKPFLLLSLASMLCSHDTPTRYIYRLSPVNHGVDKLVAGLRVACSSLD